MGRARGTRKEAGVGDGTQCLKYLMFIFNLFFFMAGCAIVGTTIWIAVDRNFMSPIMGTTLYSAATFILVAAGAIIMMIAFVGCCGAIRENKCLLLTFCVFLVVIFLTLVIGGIIGFIFRSQLTESMKEYMEKTLKESYGVDTDKDYNRAVTEAWTQAQEKLYCCGVADNGWIVYRGSQWFIRQPSLTTGGRKLGPYVPSSCCIKDHATGRYIDENTCRSWQLGPPGRERGSTNHALHYRGCYEAGKDFVFEHSGILIGIGLAIALLLICGIIFSVCLYRHLED